MRINCDTDNLKGRYDNRNLTVCRCGKHSYPSKKMLYEFLKQYKDVKGVADIWSIQHLSKGEVEIHVRITYKLKKEK